MKPTICTLTILLMALLSSSPAFAKNTVSVTMEEAGPGPTDIISSVRIAAQSYLKDPQSAQYRTGKIYLGYCKNGWIKGNDVSWKGWAVNVYINAKNSFGGYTGFQPHTAIFVGEQVVNLVPGENFGAYGPKKGFLGLDGGAGVCGIENLNGVPQR